MRQLPLGVTLPLAARGILHGAVVAFARALGEAESTVRFILVQALAALRACLARKGIVPEV